MKKRLLSFILILAMLLSALPVGVLAAEGDEVKILEVVSASAIDARTNPMEAVNGSGMTGDGIDGLCAINDVGNGMWYTQEGSHEDESVWVQFDFASDQYVGEMYVWNQNQNGGFGDHTGRGLKNIKIEYKRDGASDWTELRNEDQLANAESEYPYTLAKATGEDQMPATNLADGKGPVRFHVWAKSIRISAEPGKGNGNYAEPNGNSYGLSEVRFTEAPRPDGCGWLEEALKKLDEYTKENYTQESWAAVKTAAETARGLIYKDGLPDEEATAAIEALDAALAALVLRDDLPPFQDLTFNDATGFVPRPVAERSANAEMQLRIDGGRLHISGRQTADGEAANYQIIASQLEIPVEEGTKLTYYINPSQDYTPKAGQETAHDWPSLHLAVDLKFDDGTYLSQLDVEDENCVGINPDAQGKGQAMITRHDNLIIVDLGGSGECLGKTVTDVLVGYENSDGTEGRAFAASLDNIVIDVRESDRQKPTDYVKTTRGSNNGSLSISRGSCWAFTAMPGGFNYWLPTNSGTLFGYGNAETNNIDHFTCSHRGHTALGEVYSWNFMPTSGGSGTTIFRHENEIDRAHYYSVEFEKTGGQAAGTRVELSPTDHGVSVRFTYDQGLAKRGVVLDSMSINKATRTFSGVVTDGQGDSSWDRGKIDTMYVYGSFDTAVESVEGTTVCFAEAAGGETVVTMNLATSFISLEQAMENYKQEVKGKTFQQVYDAAEQAWLDILGRIEIEGATEDQMISFYSCLYRMFLFPTNLGEYTGEGEEGGWQYFSPHTGQVEDGKLYYNNGFWDTYRSVWAAYSLLAPTRESEYLEGLLQHYEDSGWIPRWTSAIGLNCMCGTSSDIIFGDAIQRGVQLDRETLALAYEAALKNATMSIYGNAAGGRNMNNVSQFLGYVPCDNVRADTVSWSTAAYMNDYGVAQLAKAMGDTDVYDYLMNRSLHYVNLFDTEHQWFRVRNTGETDWSEDLYPVNYDQGYQESSAYAMAFEPTWDGQGLVNLYGGREAMAAKLDGLFDCYLTPKFGSGSGMTHEMLEQMEVKMGAYQHNNQPCHHVPYMYLFAGEPTKTQERVRQVLRQCYTGSQFGQGYTGDEDCGEMSSWYVFGALGLYPLNMGSGELVFGSPLFTKATIHLENGNDIVINAPNNSSANVYVKSLSINGQAYDKTSIRQTDLTRNGAVIDFEMTADAESCTWGTDEAAVPASITTGTEAPEPLMDLTAGDTPVADAMPAATAPQDAVYCPAAQTPKQLTDNNSLTDTVLTPDGDGVASVYFHFGAPRQVEMYTLSSATRASAPASFRLYGSQDGETWTLLDEQADVGFLWDAQTKPFVAAKTGYYANYRLDLDAEEEIRLSEIELLGRKRITREALQASIDMAARMDLTKYPAAVRKQIQAVIDQARTVAAKAGAAAAELDAAYMALMADAIGAAAELDQLIALRDAYRTRYNVMYADAEWSALETALGKADAALRRDETSLRQARALLEDVNGAIDGLTIDYSRALSVRHFSDAKANGVFGCSAADAFDNNRKTNWSCISPTKNNVYWLEVILDDYYDVSAWSVLSSSERGENGDEGYRLRSFTLSARDKAADGTDKGSLVELTSVTGNNKHEFVGYLDAPEHRKWFRLTLPVPSNNEDSFARVSEFHVFGNPSDSDVAAEAKAAVDAIGTVSQESESAIAAARWKMDCLTAAQKALIEDYETVKTTLETAEAAYAELANPAAAAAVTALIDAIGDVTVESKAAIEAARAAYDELTAAQKLLVANYETLTAAEAAYAAMAVAGITLSENSLRLTVGATATLRAAVTPETALDTSYTWSTSDAAVATVADGVVTAVAAGEAVITVTTVQGGKTDTCTVTVTEPSSGGTTSKPAPKPEEPVAPAPSGSTEVKAPAATTDEKGEAQTSVDASQMSTAITEAAKENKAEVVIQPEVTGDASKVSVEVPKSSVGQMANQTEAALTVKTDIADVKIPASSLEDLSRKAGSTVTVSAEIAEDTVKIEVKVDDRPVEKLSGGVVAKVPAQSGNVLVVVNADGSETIVKKSIVDGSTVAGLVDGSCTVKIVENNKTFADTTNHWAKDAVEFAASRELFQGTSANTFSPNVPMNRAMLATVLYRLEDAAASGKSDFHDVPDGTWYTDAVTWASQKGIVSGTGNGFAPNNNVTREQLASMLYRYAKTLGMDTAVRGSLSGFADSGKTSGWAQDAMTWAVDNGLITGKGGGRLDPTGTATRAEVAAILQRMVAQMVK